MYLVESRQRLEVVVLAEVQHQCEQAEDLSVEAELQEEPVVVLSHTVVNPGGVGTTTFKTHTLEFSSISCAYIWFAAGSPGTVVVHLAYAVAASAAVVGAFGAHEIALVAQLPVLPLCRGKTTTVSQNAHSSGGDLYLVYCTCASCFHT